jgi:hypothetical protein
MPLSFTVTATSRVRISELDESWDKVSLQLPLLEKIARNYI